MHRSFTLVRIICLVALVGCDGAPATPVPPDPDQARECYPPGVDANARDGGVPGCAAGELCLEGRCYTACTDDGECGPGEMCAASGACIRATGDGGVRDAGPGDICDAVDCPAPLVCHPLSGTCVECNVDTVSAPMGAPGHCSPEVAPICDVANGRCVPTAPSQCAPCLSHAGCMVADGFVGKCIPRNVMGIQERVCMADCAEDGTCPDGLRCDLEQNVCVPKADMPCTNWLSGTRGEACLSDAECGPLGAPSSAVYRDVCEGEVIATFDGGVSTPGTCLLPCGMDSDCPGEEVCTGSPAFCRPPPSLEPSPL